MESNEVQRQERPNARKNVEHLTSYKEYILASRIEEGLRGKQGPVFLKDPVRVIIHSSVHFKNANEHLLCTRHDARPQRY